jgi:hypothetical protein
MIHRTDGAAANPSRGSWLLLVHQLPPKPSNVRVRTWRRLQELGAVAVKNSVYALPNSPAAQEDFAWVKTEIATLGGQATVFAADTVDTWSDDDLKQACRRARQADYEELVRVAARAVKGLPGEAALRGPRRNRLQRVAKTVRERLMHIQRVDFFGATGREAAGAALAELDARLSPTERAGNATTPSAGSLDPRDYRGRVWSTRPRPGIDRLSSAWLIRRHIDKDAQFAFGESKARAASTIVTFDTYDGTFTHDGPRCTFEVLTQRFGIADPITLRLGEIVHDLDLKDARFGLPEAVAVGHLIEGLRRLYADDHVLLQHGLELFEALYQGLQAADASAAAQATSAQPRATQGRGKRRAKPARVKKPGGKA